MLVEREARIAQSVQWRVSGWMATEQGFDSWQGQEISLLNEIQTGFGAHSTSYPMGAENSFYGAKQ
jgi:hypothetical protein